MEGGVRIDYKVENIEAINELLKKTIYRLQNTRAMYAKIAVLMKQNIDRNFIRQGTERGPWAPLSPTTLMRRRKQGRGAKILIDTGLLRASILPVYTDDYAAVGTNLKYARTHQFGARRGEYGRNVISTVQRRTRHGTIQYTRRIPNIPWGNIPARPFMVLDSRTYELINDIILSHLTSE
jgi:phage virion morphogenesis protein